MITALHFFTTNVLQEYYSLLLHANMAFPTRFLLRQNFYQRLERLSQSGMHAQ